MEDAKAVNSRSANLEIHLFQDEMQAKPIHHHHLPEIELFDEEDISFCQKLQSKRHLVKWISSAIDFCLYPNNSPIWIEVPKNLKSAISVALASWPLSLSLGAASGTSPTVGVLSAFWAGSIASMIGSSQYNVLGPTGALAGILLIAAQNYGSADILPILTTLSGIICFLVYLLRFETYVHFIPDSAAHGFQIGVAFILSISQINNALGIADPNQLSESFIYNLWTTIQNLFAMNPWAFAWFTINVLPLFVLVKYFPKFPWALLAATIGIIFSVLDQYGIVPSLQLITIGEKYSISFAVPVVPVNYTLNVFLDTNTWANALACALIVLLETTISARIADDMTATDHNPRREVLGIALANIVTGTTFEPQKLIVVTNSISIFFFKVWLVLCLHLEHLPEQF